MSTQCTNTPSSQQVVIFKKNQTVASTKKLKNRNTWDFLLNFPILLSMGKVLHSKISESSMCTNCSRKFQPVGMIKSLLQMKKEVDNGLKLTGHYKQCLKGTQWAVVEELSRFWSPFQDLTDLVSTSVTSLSLIQIIRKEIIDTGISKANLRDCEEVVAQKQAVQSSLDKRLPWNDSVTLATLLDLSTKNLLTT